MSKTPSTILGISLGTRSIGVAVVYDRELLFWRIKTFGEAWSKRKLNDILFALHCIVQNDEVEGLAIKEPDPNTSSDALNQLVSEVISWGKRNGFPISFYSLAQLKNRFSNHKSATKTDFMRRIGELYPELNEEFNREQQNRNPYYDKVFEAVAVALMVE